MVLNVVHVIYLSELGSAVAIGSFCVLCVCQLLAVQCVPLQNSKVMLDRSEMNMLR